MEHQAVPNSWIILATSGWIVALTVIAWSLVTRRKTDTSSITTMQSPLPPSPPTQSPPTSPSQPVEPEPDDEPELSPAELLNKYWPGDGETLADKACVALRAIKREAQVEWDDNDQVQYDEPSPSEFVELLQQRGCSTSDLLIAFYNVTGIRMGGILLHILTDVDITADDLTAAYRGAEITFDSDELANLLEADDVDLEMVLCIARNLNLSAAQVVELYEEAGLEKPDVDDLVTAARTVGFTNDDLIRGINACNESQAGTVGDAYEYGIPMDVLIAFLRVDGVDPEELSAALNEDEVLEFAERIDLLYALLHPRIESTPATVTSEADSETSPSA